jgi:tRNA (mo5U34)-methyltransferase
MLTLARFSPLVRKGLRFKKTFESAKTQASSTDFVWYPYDSFSSLFCLERLLSSAHLSLDAVIGTDPVLDLGAGDGALSFFLESLGHKVHAFDNSNANINRMQGISSLARVLNSHITIADRDLDSHLSLPSQCGLALFLGTLYHLRNPYGVLDAIAHSARFCFLSTRIASLSTDHQTPLENLPVAWLLDERECNGDITNYWIFSYAGLLRLANRTGWKVCATLKTGADASDPVSADADQRAFLLLRSTRV